METLDPNHQRTIDATRLVEDFNLQEDAEYFADPATRVDFLTSVTADEFFDISQHINARVRGFEPSERKNADEAGGRLPMLGTPDPSEKPEAFRAGFGAIQNYLLNSDDSPEQKVKGAAMATEALLIWVHPFNDGNGRTSRFFGKFIEEGTTDTEKLIAETADKNNRLRMYDSYLRVDTANTNKGLDLMLDDDEIEELKKTEMPVAEGIALSLTKLLEDKTRQQRVELQTARLQEKLRRAQARFAA